ncbi:MAG TPA: nuclear transport factor 2 family protein [Candidatus Acidoferrum sp.]|nr:nuclear transport factor 2 family protein [Candidatus Acidoferrum sp.]
MKTRLFFITLLAISVSIGLARLAAHPGNPFSKVNSLQQQIISKEREELDSLKTGSMELFFSLLADNAVFVDAHGSAGKDEVVKNTGEFRLTEYTMEDVRFVPVSADSGLIAYKLTEKGTSHGKEFAGQVYVSALWIERQGKWVCLFSQETAAK